MNKFKIFFLSFSIIIIFVSCKSGNNVNVEFEDGISEPIRDLLGDDLLNVLENDLGLPIHRGKNPPNVEARLLTSSSSIGQATVMMQPTILESTNVPNDGIQPGGRFRDTLFRFSNQDNKNLTVDFDRIVLGSNPFLGENSFIIGKGKKFSVFGKQLDIVEQDTVVSVNFLSGTMDDNGIRDAFGGIIVVDDQGIGVFIPSGTGRVFVDGDGFAELGKWPSTGEGEISKMNTDQLIMNYRLND
ncbi:MAG: hypothetical protein U5K72_18850 [Balneolaceae bacterium]|nr:hypothetical protein [Balneolaceae bacterium]